VNHLREARGWGEGRNGGRGEGKKGKGKARVGKPLENAGKLGLKAGGDQNVYADRDQTQSRSAL
jgi:hypothetical protein